MANLVNPYIAGAPVTEVKMFFGRADVFDWIENSIAGQYADHILVVHGQRRVGKTSVLKQLGNRLPKRFIPVFFDLQGRTHTTLDRFLWWLAREIVRVLKQERDIDLPLPEKESFIDPEFFENRFLPEVHAQLADNTLLLTFDEFDNLEEGEIKEELARPLIDYLRRLMGNSKINFIFSIGSSGRKLENMQADYTEFFKTALYKKISFLNQAQTRDLVTRPVEGVLEYDKASIARIVNIAGGHPYFTQLTCHELFARCQRTEQRRINEADVEAVLDDVVERGTVNLKFVWDEASDIEKWCLAALAHLGKVDNHALADFLHNQRVRFSESDLTSALLHLREKDVLTADNRFVIALLDLWLKKNRPIEQVREELTEVNPIANRYIEIGLEFKDSGAFDKAIESFQEALAVAPGNTQAQVNIALTYMDQKQPAQAVVEFEKALTIDEEDVAARSGLCDAHLALGDAAMTKNRMRDALQSYQRVLAINTEHTEARQRMAELSRQRAEKSLTDGRDEEALTAFAEALKFAPEDPGLVKRAEMVRQQKTAKVLSSLTVRADKAVAAKDFDLAISMLQEALGLAPQDESIRANIASIEERKQNEQLDAVLTRADQAEKSAKWDVAISALNDYLALKPGETRIQSRLNKLIESKRSAWLKAVLARADEALEAQQWDEAITALNEVLGLEADNAEFKAKVAKVREAEHAARVEGLLKRATAASKAGRWDEAIELLNEGSSLEPDNVSFQTKLVEMRAAKRSALLRASLRLADTAAQSEKWDLALASLNDILKTEPDNVEAKKKLEKVAKWQALAKSYAEAHQSYVKKNYDKAIISLKEVVAQDVNYKDASRLLAEAIELRRTARKWWQNKRVWGAGGGIIVLVLGWFALQPDSPLGAFFAPTAAPAALAGSPTSTTMPTAIPTAIPLAWSRLNSGLFQSRDTITAIVFDPTDAGIIYVGTENSGIYKSIDGGLSWRPSHTGLIRAAIYGMAIDPENPETVYATGDVGVLYISRNGGETWSFIDITGEPEAGACAPSTISIDPNDSNHLLWSSGCSAFFDSEDGGTIWSPITSPDAEGNLCPYSKSNVMISPENGGDYLALSWEGSNPNGVYCPGGLYLSRDRGNTWELAEPRGQHFWQSHLAALKTGTSLYYFVSTDQEFFSTSDNGATWQKPMQIGCSEVAAGLEGGAYAVCGNLYRFSSTFTWDLVGELPIPPKTLAVSPHNPDLILLGGSGLFISADGGETWEERSSGLPAYPLKLHPSPSDPQIFYGSIGEGGGYQNLYRTLNGGSDWIQLTDKGIGFAIDSTGQTIYRTDESNYTRYDAWVSSDAGVTWASLTLPFGDRAVALRLFTHPTEPGTLYASVETEDPPYFYYSFDSGVTWNASSTFGRTGGFIRLAFANQSDTIYAPAWDAVQKSSDSGRSWSGCGATNAPIDFYSQIMAVDPGDGNRVYLATMGKGVLTSSDGCQSWHTINNGLGSLFVYTVVVDPNDPATLYAGTDSGAFMSTDNGESWGQINEGLLGAVVVRSIVVDPESNVYAATPYGIFKLEQ